jgi:glutathione S-transferase
VPGIVGFAIYISPVLAASIGCVYLLGRVLYFFGYRVAAEKRTTGALMTLISNFVLVIGAVVGVIFSLA